MWGLNRENLNPRPCCIDRATARSLRQSKDRAFEVNKLFVRWLFASVCTRARNRPVGTDYGRIIRARFLSATNTSHRIKIHKRYWKAKKRPSRTRRQEQPCVVSKVMVFEIGYRVWPLSPFWSEKDDILVRELGLLPWMKLNFSLLK